MPRRHPSNPPISALIDQRLDRRTFMAFMGAAALTARPGPRRREPLRPPSASSLRFAEIAQGRDETLHVPTGYDAHPVMRWGDPLHANAPDFDPFVPDVSARKQQFGENADYVAFLPLDEGSTRGLLCVNHEFTRVEMFFPGIESIADGVKLSRAHAECELASQGHTIAEVGLVDGRWTLDRNSVYNRRINGLDTVIRISGPAAGSPRMQTRADPTGRRVLGTFANCAGGTTPWGTVLTCEENFQSYFLGNAAKHEETGALARYGVDGKLGSSSYRGRFLERFDLDREPRECNRFGWVVEIDPHDPWSMPVKRTALGRFRHEGATCVVAADGRLVVYTGDDDQGEYLYRYVSEGKVDPHDRRRNGELLDHGTLSVARFEADGSLIWRPLVFGQGPLGPKNGFQSQACVLIEARRAGDLVGATPMDRPEDVETNPVNGHVYVMLTNNTKRTVEQVDAANPRARNVHGHVLELIAPDGDHTADRFLWEMFLQGGNPARDSDRAYYQDRVISENGWVSCPDNCAFDPQGRLWIATDGHGGSADGVFACDTEGEGRAQTRMFLRAPQGAEVCGPTFTPDATTFFCAIQHPGAGGKARFASPYTRWPDFVDGRPARSSVVAVRRLDGGLIGD
ncbi:MAG: PhoX family phosphatase [Planctomycetes bacterium]|nr:PhoX family phosphatase [Planctomycetota bacterium]